MSKMTVLYNRFASDDAIVSIDGEPQTLGEWKTMATYLFGAKSKAVEMLADRIAVQGPNEKVLTGSKQMIWLLTALHRKPKQ